VTDTWRWDKTDPVDTIRGRLAADWLAADVGEIIGVGFNASGLLVKGAGTTGVIGVAIFSQAYKAGRAVDAVKRGEAVGGVNIVPATPAIAGRSYSISATGTKTATADGVRGTLGLTAEADRLIVDFQNAL
jgi:hypothetical protein